MGKPSSTISAKVAYERALEAGYAPVLLDPDEAMHSSAWDAVKGHRNVQHSKSGDSIILAHEKEPRRPVLTLKTKGMLSDSEVDYFEKAGGLKLRGPSRS